MKFSEFLKNNIVCLDGGMGTLLQSKGLRSGELPERWNITHPEVITEIHKSYYDAGSNVVCTNTFGANVLKFSLIVVSTAPIMVIYPFLQKYFVQGIMIGSLKG